MAEENMAKKIADLRKK